jgi:hypothetical protein
MSARLNANPRTVLMDEREVAALRAEIERLRAALGEFARQKTEDEMNEEEYDMADVWGAYELFIRRAREALGKSL